MRIYSRTGQEKAEKLYEAFLEGRLPEEGCIVTEGPRLYLLDSPPSLQGGLPQPAEGGDVPLFAFPGTEERAAAAYRSYRDGRRLPAGCVLAAVPEGILVFPESAWTPDLGSMAMFRLSFDPLEEVLTPKEASDLFGVDVKRIQSDCEEAGAGILSRRAVRKSDKTWLLSRREAAAAYGAPPEERLFPDPLLLVFSSTEAAKIWNRDSGAVRNAAGGAGHMSARMGDGERRKSGRTWLVTRDAMNRLFGQFVPERMKEAMKDR